MTDDVPDIDPVDPADDRTGFTLDLAAAGATSLAALVVGSVGIGRSFNYDEGVTYASFVNGGSPVRALTNQVVFNNHQMFSLIQSIVWRIGLRGETPQRMLPVLCGVATVGLLTWWMSRHVSTLAGVAAGVTLLLNPVYLPEFRSLRGYALSTLAVLVAAVATHRSWRDDRHRWLVISGVAMTVAVTTHAYSVLGVVMFAIATVALGRLRVVHLVTWACAAVATALIQLPLLDDAIEQSEARGTVYKPLFLRLTTEFYLGRRTSVVVLMAGLALVGAVVMASRSKRHVWALVGSSSFLFIVVLLLWQVVQPSDLFARFFVSLTPYLAALVGAGIAAVPYRLGAIPLVVLAALLWPNTQRVLDVDPPIRRAAEVVDVARADGLSVCGAFTIPLEVYTAPVRAIEPSDVDDYGDCELFVAVLGIGEAGRAVAGERFERRLDAGGGVTIYSSESFASRIEPLI